jgi:hypothetical protein
MGLTFHRFVCYGIILWAVVLLFRIMIRTPKIYAEKYVVIFISLMIGILWQTIMIFSRTPIDRSMIGIGIFGILTFYFSLFYRPMRLLDRMLGDIVSEMPEMMFFFDNTHKCIWANAPAKRFVGIRDDQLDEASPRLIEKFGRIEDDSDNWNLQKMVLSEDGMKYYAIEKKTDAPIMPVIYKLRNMSETGVIYNGSQLKDYHAINNEFKAKMDLHLEIEIIR